MSAINLLKLQQESGYYGRCFICGELISPDRLKRGGDTCSQEHQAEKRKAYNRFRKMLALARLLSSPTVRRQAIAVEAQERAGSSAPEVSHAV